MHMSLNKLWGVVKDKEAWCAAVHDIAKIQTQLSDWTAASKGKLETNISHEHKDENAQQVSANQIQQFIQK